MTESGVSTVTGGIHVGSPVLEAGWPIPKRYTADGDDESPSLSWSEPPPETKSFVVLCEDPDADNPPFRHWIVWGIPAGKRELRAETASMFAQGRNDGGTIGYTGPRPPRDETHRYEFRVLALDIVPDVPNGASYADLARAMEGHVLDEGELVATYTEGD